MTDVQSVIQTQTTQVQAASSFNWQQLIEILMTLVGALFTYSFHTNSKATKSSKIMDTIMSVAEAQVHSVEQQSQNLKVPMYSGQKKETAVKIAKSTLKAAKINVSDDVLSNMVETQVHKMKTSGTETKAADKLQAIINSLQPISEVSETVSGAQTTSTTTESK